MSSNFYILRHAETFATVNTIPGEENYHDKKLTADILDQGRLPIQRIGEYLKNIKTDVNLVSPIKRCLQTAEIIKEYSGKQFKIDEKLHEFYEENFEDLKKRVSIFLDENKDIDDILICTHGAVVSALKHLILEGSYKFEQIHDYPRPGVLITIKGKVYQEKDFNIS